MTRASYLTVNSVVLDTPAWWIRNLDPEILKVAVKGADLDIPAAAGSLAFPRRIAPVVLQFDMRIVGYYDRTGSAQASHQGIITNVEYLKANLGIASATGDGTVTAVWTRPNASTKSAQVVVSHFETSDLDKRNVSAVLELTVRDGVWS